MKRKVTRLALIFLCIIIFAVVGNLSCLEKMESSEDQKTRFQASLNVDLITFSTSMIEPRGPGSGGGRGPTPILL